MISVTAESTSPVSPFSTLRRLDSKRSDASGRASIPNSGTEQAVVAESRRVTNNNNIIIIIIIIIILNFLILQVVKKPGAKN